MTTPKLIVAAVWILSIVAWIAGWGGILGLVVKSLAPLMAVAHIVEFVVYREVFAKAGGSTAAHFFNTFIFGVFHINPLREGLEGNSPADG